MASNFEELWRKYEFFERVNILSRNSVHKFVSFFTRFKVKDSKYRRSHKAYFRKISPELFSLCGISPSSKESYLMHAQIGVLIGGSHMVLRALCSKYFLAAKLSVLLFITRAYKRTSSASLQILTGVMPLHL